MRMYFKEVLLIVFILISVSCSSDKNNNLNDSENVTDDEDVQGADQKEPGDDFFTPSANVKYTFKGYINNYDDVNGPDENKGEMDLKIKTDDLEMELNDIPTSYTYEITDNSGGQPETKKILAIVSAGGVVQEGEIASYYIFSNTFNIKKLVEIKKSGIREFSMADADATANVQHYYLKSRTDGSRLFRKCLYAITRSDSGTRFFMNHDANSDFSVGETMFSWGNIIMTKEFNPEELNTKLYEYEDEYCSFSLDGNPLTKEEYEKELIKDVAEFECDFPEGYLDKKSEESVVFKFKGKMGSSAFDTTVQGIGSCNVFLDGNENSYLDYYMAGPAVDKDNNDLVVLSAIGNLETMESNEHYKFDLFQLVILKNLLLEELENGKESCLYDDYTSNTSMVSYVSSIENKSTATVTYQKICTIAMTAADPAPSSVFLCIKNNKEFVTGETVEIAGNISLNNETEYMVELSEVNSSEELCYCVEATQNSEKIIECSVFDEY